MLMIERLHKYVMDNSYLGLHLEYVSRIGCLSRI